MRTNPRLNYFQYNIYVYLRGVVQESAPQIVKFRIYRSFHGGGDDSSNIRARGNIFVLFAPFIILVVAVAAATAVVVIVGAASVAAFIDITILLINHSTLIHLSLLFFAFVRRPQHHSLHFQSCIATCFQKATNAFSKLHRDTLSESNERDSITSKTQNRVIFINIWYPPMMTLNERP